MKIFDSHIHLFTDKIIRNVKQKKALVKRLKLQTHGAEKRSNAHQFIADTRFVDFEGALLLPTANVAGVRKTNLDCINTASTVPCITTAGTLHPDAPDVQGELAFLRQHRVRVIKLCSFSQGFVLDGPKAIEMFDAIQSANEKSDAPFAVVLDTLRTADRHFGTHPDFNTTPERLASLVDRYPGINFIGAHMGGLDAPYDEIRRHLAARSNLYLDTSNAAHTLTDKAFCTLVAHHGPDHIVFGTDWPWFTHKSEVHLIDSLLDRAGFSEKEKTKVFYGNICRLIEI